MSLLRVYGFSQIEEHFSHFFTDRTFIGARMMGRGAAGGAHVDGLESIEWNPAGLACSENFFRTRILPTSRSKR